MSNSTAKLTLIGGPTILIETGGLRLLTDPTFDPPGSYQSGPITLQKNAGPALSVADLGRIDAVLLSMISTPTISTPPGARCSPTYQRS